MLGFHAEQRPGEWLLAYLNRINPERYFRSEAVLLESVFNALIVLPVVYAPFPDK